MHPLVLQSNCLLYLSQNHIVMLSWIHGWKSATDEEMIALLANETCELTFLLSGK